MRRVFLIVCNIYILNKKLGMYTVIVIVTVIVGLRHSHSVHTE